MMKKRRNHVFIWLLLVLLILSASLMLILFFNGSKLSAWLIITGSLLWVSILFSGIMLFTYASNWSISLLNKPEEEDKRAEQVPKKKTPRKESDEGLDIKGISNKIVRRLRIDSNPVRWGEQLLNYLVEELEIMSGVFYYKNTTGTFRASASFALPQADDPYEFKEGEGLTGHAVKVKQVSLYRKIPEEYGEVYSGLGKAKPSYLAMIPILKKDKVIAVIELTGFRWADAQLDQLFQILSRELSEKLSAESTSQTKDG